MSSVHPLYSLCTFLTSHNYYQFHITKLVYTAEKYRLIALGWCGLQVSCSSCPVATPSVVTTLPGSRIIRQSSQPEASAPCCGSNCVHGAAPSTSLRQLRDHGDGIAGIAADSLRINGAMRNFRQV